MQQYETTFILTPVLSEDDIKQSIDGYRKHLTDGNAEIINEEAWGLRQLAYPIKKKTTGIYHHIEFKADNEMVTNLEIQYRRDENVMRFLTVKLDKYAIDYNERRARGEIGRNRKKEEEEAVAEKNEPVVAEAVTEAPAEKPAPVAKTETPAPAEAEAPAETTEATASAEEAKPAAEGDETL